jgi:CRP-like cAMP-binding protein
MLCVEDLVNLDPFQALPKEIVELQAGEVLAQEGEPAQGLFILVEGHISMTRRSEGMEIPIGQHDAPSFLGKFPSLQMNLFR